MRTKKRFLPVPVILFLFGILVGCTGKDEETVLQLPSTSVLAIRSNWGVVESNYLRMRINPSKNAEVVDGLIKGTVVKVISSTDREETIEDETAYWYRIDLDGLKGWVFGAYLAILDSRAQADELAREIK